MAQNKRTKYLFFFIVLSHFLMEQKAIYAQTPPSDTLKAVTFNLYGKPQTEWDTRLSLMLNELALIRPDYIGVQEVVEPSGSNTARALADSLRLRTGLPYRYIYSNTHFSWDTYNEGIGIITPHLILEQDVKELPQGVFPRKALYARVLTPTGIINFFNTHLSYGNQQEVRNAQSAAIKEFIMEKSSDNTAAFNLLNGDFNSGPEAYSIQLLTNPDSGPAFLDSWVVINPADPGYTMPSDMPNDRIDYIFLREGDFGSILSSQQVLKTPNQDGLYPSDHFGVFSQFGSTRPKVSVTIDSPAVHQEVSGVFSIAWSVEESSPEWTATLYLTDNAGLSWSKLWQGAAEDGSYRWDTSPYTDGTRYKIKLALTADSAFGFAETAPFSVNNPGNAKPEIEVIAPRRGSSINGTYAIEWQAGDADGDTLRISILASSDAGKNWFNLTGPLPDTGSYLWETGRFANSANYQVIVRADDDSTFAADTTALFTVNNPRKKVSDSLIVHTQGRGSGSIQVNVFDQKALNGHTYRITFNDTLFDETVYDVYDLNNDSLLVDKAFQMDGVSEGPPFAGVRLIIHNFPEAMVDHENTGWLIGQTNLTHQVTLASVIIGDEHLEGFPSASDYAIELYDTVVDTSDTYLGAAAMPMKFKVFNRTENRQVDILYIDGNSDQTISPGDEIYILEKDASGNPMLTWYLYFSGYEPIVLPQAGDEFVLTTLKPFSTEDVFEFDLSTVGMEPIRPVGLLKEFHLSQNFPNPFNPGTVISYQLPAFSKVEITVYNVLGQKVRTLLNERQEAGRHSVTFNADGLAGGLYFYRIKAGSFKQTRKMILLR